MIDKRPQGFRSNPELGGSVAIGTYRAQSNEPFHGRLTKDVKNEIVATFADCGLEVKKIDKVYRGRWAFVRVAYNDTH